MTRTTERLARSLVAAALIDRLVHHSQIVTLKGKSCRLKERGAGAVPAEISVVHFSVPETGALFGSC